MPDQILPENNKKIDGQPSDWIKEYLDSLPNNVKKALGSIRKAIISAAPEAAKYISYRVPFYRLNGHLAAHEFIAVLLQ